MGSCLRSGNCCTSFGVCITHMDIFRINKSTKLEPIEFVMAIPEQPNRERTEPSVIIDNKKSLVVLNWKFGMVCKFYSDAGCEIYLTRPILCKTYPFCLIKNRLENMKSRACPRNWIPEGREKEQYFTDLKQYENEVKTYSILVKKWNKKGGGSLKNFLAFIIKSFK